MINKTLTLKEFLKKNDACEDGYLFAKDLTLEQFLATCKRGDWILWLFAKSNPDSIKELILAKAHCANTVRHLMKDERSIRAVDVAIAFGEGRATKEELYKAHKSVYEIITPTYTSSASYATSSAAYASYAGARARAYYASNTAVIAHYAAYARAASYAAYEDDYIRSQKLTSDICRRYLPIEIWNQKIFKEL